MSSTQIEENITEDKNLTSVSVNDLIVGRVIQFPIYDLHGVLLLAENSEITQERKRAMRQHGVLEVRISQEDFRRVTVNAGLTNLGPTTIGFDEALTKRIDTIIDGGLMALKNDGPAVKNDVVFLGRKGYNQQKRKELIEQHKSNGKALGDMISEVMHGEKINGSMVSTMAAHYLKEMTTDTDNVLTSVIDQFQDDDIASRSMEVSLLAMAIGIEMDLDADNTRNLAIAGLIHDWGMMKVPPEIRSTDKKLNSLELLEIQKHPIYSLEMLQHVSALPTVIPVIAYQVHERMNGKGYPRGRRGLSIHPLARILQVADAFVGMTSKRPYRPALMRYAAMECLIRQARENYVDSKVVRTLLRVQSLFPIGSFVQLSDESIAQVTRRNQDYYTEPIVTRIQNASGDLVDREADENLIDLHEEVDLHVTHALPTPGSGEINYSEDSYFSSLNS
ncbi:HD domain-containing phosphohydrolase [Rubinisphaera sp.]|uniref:HD-GYP domain-containing protein n=1 Tax=Rubinisphaera sp. TaxID=2024857 RepID=UPI000C0CC07E|nr:HD domain-containing phosphohydrolase [Rubinisphaera sp.]MBV09517.1 hypothetical protein [Rubinisphaera sp.]HCS52117.1 hypothetical protein [Planctomycetaceae bacterium]|tara:strand:- start:9424 stop:10767 length:1344 start_codon:yes stop_codon:yes gene_type:complete